MVNVARSDGHVTTDPAQLHKSSPFRLPKFRCRDLLNAAYNIYAGITDAWRDTSDGPHGGHREKNFGNGWRSWRIGPLGHQEVWLDVLMSNYHPLMVFFFGGPPSLITCFPDAVPIAIASSLRPWFEKAIAMSFWSLVLGLLAALACAVRTGSTGTSCCVNQGTNFEAYLGRRLCLSLDVWMVWNSWTKKKQLLCDGRSFW